MKDSLQKQVDEFWEERKANEGLLPEKDQKAIDLEVVKEQILDLNDKFDYLLYVMMKDRRLESKGEDYQLVSEAEQQKVQQQQTANYHSINSHVSNAAVALEELEVKDQVKNFV